MNLAPENQLAEARENPKDHLKSILPPALIFALALLLRAIYLVSISDHPFFRAPVVDAETYLTQARRIAAGHLLEGESFWQPPLYPYLLGFALWLFGENHFLLHFLHALLGAVNCVLLYFLGRKILGVSAAFLIGVAAAGYGPFIFFEGDYAVPVVIVFLDLMILICLLRLRESGRLFLFLLTGLCFGLSALGRPDVLLFLPLALVWLALTLRRSLSRQRLGIGLCFLIFTTLLAISPATLHNWIVSREFVPISSNFGANFYLGNNQNWRETVNLRPSLAWDQLMTLPFRAGAVKPGERSHYFVSLTLAEMRAHPAAFLGRLLIKTGKFFYGHEYFRNVDLYFFREQSFLLRLLVWERGIAFPYGILSPLAVMGLILFLYSRKPDQVLLALFAASQVLAVALFFVTSRYRMPVIPVFLLAAAGLVLQLVDWWRTRELKKLGLTLATMTALLVASNFGIGRAPRMSEEEIHLRLGEALSRLGRNEEAEKELKTALQLSPSSPDAHLQLGVHYLRQNQLAAARKHFEIMLTLDQTPPTMITAHAARYLAEIELLQGNLVAAEKWFQHSVAAYPFLGPARLGLAQVYLQQGKPRQAEQELLLLLKYNPRDSRLLTELSRLELKLGRPQLAAEFLKRARELE